ncbi:Oidioi.mRNA.OKI2018_I69.chr2.g5722.t1.cds [Oikopleura dioica]|uniref:Oidioi.mRNA.OKI2018_I69.chr2.g5722.t1.cds n=1 Tax=Oikopleura dioica TaxID=34765 RepID=A0ABN7T0Q3_OIKDI|nr:Oidioi.mRNA.OKI2018_I69.chr2.g5722.t1.cds [Oikopleura dioica]
MTRLLLLIALQSSVTATPMKKNPCSKKLCQNCYYMVQVEKVSHKQCLQLLNMQGCCTPFLHIGGMFTVQKDKCGNRIQPVAVEIPLSEVDLRGMTRITGDQMSEEVELLLEENEDELEERPAEVQCAQNLEAASNIIIAGVAVFVASVGGAMLYLNRQYNKRELKFKRLRSQKQDKTKQRSSSSMIGSVAIGSTIPLLASENKGQIGSDAEKPKIESVAERKEDSRSDGCHRSP